MYSTLLMIILLGAYLFYNTSKKVKFHHRPEWLKKFSAQRPSLRLLSIAMLILPFGVVVYLQGVGAGFFAFFAYLMCLLSLVVLLGPYRYLKRPHVFALYLFCLCIEFFIV
jgi:hypothetical protein